MPVLLIARKDLLLLVRDRMALFWVIGFPLVFALFFGSVMKAGVEAKTAPLDVVLVAAADRPDAEALAQAFVRAGLHLTRASAVAASDAVRRGEALAYVRFGEHPETPLELGVDPSRRAESALLESLIRTAFHPRGASDDLAIRTKPVARAGAHAPSGFEIVFPAMLIWGLLGCVATFAVSLVSERSAGTLLRLRAAPIARASILGGKSLACALSCIADAVLLSALAAFVLGVHIDDMPKYIAALGACTICFTGLTMALSVLGDTEQSVAGAGWATLLVLAMIGGAMVPVSIMPSWLVALSELSPVRWGIFALEGAVWRDLHWRELAKPLLLLAAFGIVSFSAGACALVFRREV